jgi:hypothetical protein
VVEQPFSLNEPADSTSLGDAKAGEGCYISTTVNNRRYYGVLIDQAALKSASHLYFQDEASSLDVNRRMKALKDQYASEDAESNGAVNGDSKRPALDDLDSDERKRQKIERVDAPGSSALVSTAQSTGTVQKLRYVEGTVATQGYRVLIATYADIQAASEDDPEKEKAIESACVAGGNYVGRYYYQYQVRCGVQKWITFRAKGRC